MLVIMSKRELVAHELDKAAEEDLDALLDLIRAIKVGAPPAQRLYSLSPH